MDAQQFRELLVVAKEFKVESFKTPELEVTLSPVAFYSETKGIAEIGNTPDADELMLKHIEKLKADTAKIYPI